ncbi:MAG: hypothetical protein EOL87_15940 [Spartobacteria bacterium]|nr:hypothetical protein [Spartobacteria bacterium]
MKDEIIQEVWKTKDEIASRHGYDLRRLATSIQNKEMTCEHVVVNLHDRENRCRTISGTVRR